MYGHLLVLPKSVLKKPFSGALGLALDGQQPLHIGHHLVAIYDQREPPAIVSGARRSFCRPQARCQRQGARG